MLLSLYSLWEGPAPDTCGHILTEGGDFLDTEASDRLVTECFVPAPVPVVARADSGVGGVYVFGGKPDYSKPKRKPSAQEFYEEELEEELEEILSMLGIEL